MEGIYPPATTSVVSGSEPMKICRSSDSALNTVTNTSNSKQDVTRTCRVSGSGALQPTDASMLLPPSTTMTHLVAPPDPVTLSPNTLQGGGKETRDGNVSISNDNNHRSDDDTTGGATYRKDTHASSSAVQHHGVDADAGSPSRDAYLRDLEQRQRQTQELLNHMVFCVQALLQERETAAALTSGNIGGSVGGSITNYSNLNMSCSSREASFLLTGAGSRGASTNNATVVAMNTAAAAAAAAATTARQERLWTLSEASLTASTVAASLLIPSGQQQSAADVEGRDVGRPFPSTTGAPPPQHHPQQPSDSATIPNTNNNSSGSGGGGGVVRGIVELTSVSRRDGVSANDGVRPTWSTAGVSPSSSAAAAPASQSSTTGVPGSGGGHATTLPPPNLSGQSFSLLSDASLGWAGTTQLPTHTPILAHSALFSPTTHTTPGLVNGQGAAISNNSNAVPAGTATTPAGSVGGAAFYDNSGSYGNSPSPPLRHVSLRQRQGSMVTVVSPTHASRDSPQDTSVSTAIAAESASAFCIATPRSEGDSRCVDGAWQEAAQATGTAAASSAGEAVDANHVAAASTMVSEEERDGAAVTGTLAQDAQRESSNPASALRSSRGVSTLTHTSAGTTDTNNDKDTCSSSSSSSLADVRSSVASGSVSGDRSPVHRVKTASSHAPLPLKSAALTDGAPLLGSTTHAVAAEADTDSHSQRRTSAQHGTSVAAPAVSQGHSASHNTATSSNMNSSVVAAGGSIMMAAAGLSTIMAPSALTAQYRMANSASATTATAVASSSTVTPVKEPHNTLQTTPLQQQQQRSGHPNAGAVFVTPPSHGRRTSFRHSASLLASSSSLVAAAGSSGCHSQSSSSSALRETSRRLASDRSPPHAPVSRRGISSRTSSRDFLDAAAPHTNAATSGMGGSGIHTRAIRSHKPLHPISKTVPLSSRRDTASDPLDALLTEMDEKSHTPSRVSQLHVAEAAAHRSPSPSSVTSLAATATTATTAAAVGGGGEGAVALGGKATVRSRSGSSGNSSHTNSTDQPAQTGEEESGRQPDVPAPPPPVAAQPRRVASFAASVDHGTAIGELFEQTCRTTVEFGRTRQQLSTLVRCVIGEREKRRRLQRFVVHDVRQLLRRVGKLTLAVSKLERSVDWLTKQQQWAAETRAFRRGDAGTNSVRGGVPRRSGYHRDDDYDDDDVDEEEDERKSDKSASDAGSGNAADDEEREEEAENADGSNDEDDENDGGRDGDAVQAGEHRSTSAALSHRTERQRDCKCRNHSRNNDSCASISASWWDSVVEDAEESVELTPSAAGAGTTALIQTPHQLHDAANSSPPRQLPHPPPVFSPAAPPPQGDSDRHRRPRSNSDSHTDDRDCAVCEQQEHEQQQQHAAAETQGSRSGPSASDKKVSRAVLNESLASLSLNPAPTNVVRFLPAARSSQSYTPIGASNVLPTATHSAEQQQQQQQQGNTMTAAKKDDSRHSSSSSRNANRGLEGEEEGEGVASTAAAASGVAATVESVAAPTRLATTTAPHTATVPSAGGDASVASLSTDVPAAAATAATAGSLSLGRSGAVVTADGGEESPMAANSMTFPSTISLTSVPWQNTKQMQSDSIPSLSLPYSIAAVKRKEEANAAASAAARGFLQAKTECPSGQLSTVPTPFSRQAEKEEEEQEEAGRRPNTPGETQNEKKKRSEDTSEGDADELVTVSTASMARTQPEDAEAGEEHDAERERRSPSIAARTSADSDGPQRLSSAARPSSHRRSSVTAYQQQQQQQQQRHHLPSSRVRGASASSVATPTTSDRSPRAVQRSRTQSQEQQKLPPPPPQPPTMPSPCTTRGAAGASLSSSPTAGASKAKKRRQRRVQPHSMSTMTVNIALPYTPWDAKLRRHAAARVVTPEKKGAEAVVVAAGEKGGGGGIGSPYAAARVRTHSTSSRGRGSAPTPASRAMAPTAAADKSPATKAETARRTRRRSLVSQRTPLSSSSASSPSSAAVSPSAAAAAARGSAEGDRRLPPPPLPSSSASPPTAAAAAVVVGVAHPVSIVSARRLYEALRLSKGREQSTGPSDASAAAAIPTAVACTPVHVTEAGNQHSSSKTTPTIPAAPAPSSTPSAAAANKGEAKRGTGTSPSSASPSDYSASSVAALTSAVSASTLYGGATPLTPGYCAAPMPNREARAGKTPHTSGSDGTSPLTPPAAGEKAAAAVATAAVEGAAVARTLSPPPPLQHNVTTAQTGVVVAGVATRPPMSLTTAAAASALALTQRPSATCVSSSPCCMRVPSILLSRAAHEQHSSKSASRSTAQANRGRGDGPSITRRSSAQRANTRKHSSSRSNSRRTSSCVLVSTTAAHHTPQKAPQQLNELQGAQEAHAQHTPSRPASDHGVTNMTEGEDDVRTRMGGHAGETKTAVVLECDASPSPSSTTAAPLPGDAPVNEKDGKHSPRRHSSVDTAAYLPRCGSGMSTAASHDRRQRMLMLPPPLSVATLSDASLSMLPSTITLEADGDAHRHDLQNAAPTASAAVATTTLTTHLPAVYPSRPAQPDGTQRRRSSKPLPLRKVSETHYSSGSAPPLALRDGLLQPAVAGKNRSYTDDVNTVAAAAGSRHSVGEEAEAFSWPSPHKQEAQRTKRAAQQPQRPPLQRAAIAPDSWSPTARQQATSNVRGDADGDDVVEDNVTATVLRVDEGSDAPNTSESTAASEKGTGQQRGDEGGECRGDAAAANQDSGSVSQDEDRDDDDDETPGLADCPPPPSSFLFDASTPVSVLSDSLRRCGLNSVQHRQQSHQ